MSEILVIILAYLPIPAELLLLVLVVRYLKKHLVKVSEAPGKAMEESKRLRLDLEALSSKLKEVVEANEQLVKDNEDLKLEIKGIIRHEKE